MLTRKFLASKGLEAEVIEEIIQAHGDTVNGLREEMDKLKDKYKDYEALKEKANKLDATRKELNDLQAEVAKNGDYDKLKAEFEAYKKDIENKAIRAKKEEAYKGILKDAGIPEKHFAKILKYSDVDGVELDDEGNIKTASDIMASIKEEWGDHIEKKQTKGAPTPKPPKQGSGSTLSKDEIMKIKDTKERQEALKEYLLKGDN